MNCRKFTNKEKKWIASLEKVMKKAPNTLFMFVGGSCGYMVVYPKDENNERYLNGTSMLDCDESVPIETGIDMDGGDW